MSIHKERLSQELQISFIPFPFIVARSHTRLLPPEVALSSPNGALQVVADDASLPSSKMEALEIEGKIKKGAMIRRNRA